MRRSKLTGLKIKLSLFALTCMFFNPILGQDDCEVELSSKTIKLLEKGSSKKNSRMERIAYLEEALEVDENCLECLNLLGKEYFKKAKAGNASYSKPEEYYKELIRLCPDYHSDPYYYLGVITYGRMDYVSALSYFNAFVSFPLDDESKFSSDYDKNYDDVKEVIKELEFKASFYGNPVPFDPVKVKHISTKADEYLPTLSPDNEMIFFTRKRMHQAKGDLFPREIEELSLGIRMNMESDFDEGTAMEPPFNLGDNYGGISLSINNKEMFITVCKPRSDGYNNCDIYVTRYEKSFDESVMAWEWGWSELENLGPNINTDDGWEAQPTISGDGKTIYFATARENSLENSIDLFQSTRDDSGNWSPAIPIEGDINTTGNEKSPFIHSDSKTLYFSCDSREGAGGYDIYYTRQDEKGSWSKPLNIGYPISSDKDEHGLIVSTDGSTAYYASNQISGHNGYDIYRFDLPKDAKPENIVLLKGSVDKEEDESIEDIKVTLRNVQTKKVEELDLDQDDGSFTVVMNVEKNDYVLEVEKEGAPFEAHVFTKNEDGEVRAVEKVEYKPKEIELQEEYIINDIHYTSNSADFDKSSEYMLEAFAAYLIKYPSMKISIQGHTDNVGDDLANYALSADRAFTVKLFLESKGVQDSRIEFKGLGEKEPIATNDTEEGRALNRRTTFKVIKN